MKNYFTDAQSPLGIEPRRQQNPTSGSKFVVRTHKPDVPEDQKMVVEQLQRSVILKVGRIGGQDGDVRRLSHAPQGAFWVR